MLLSSMSPSPSLSSAFASYFVRLPAPNTPFRNWPVFGSLLVQLSRCSFGGFLRLRFHPSMNPENDTEQSTPSTDFLCDAVRLLSTHPFRCLTCMCPAFASLHAFAVRDSFYVSVVLTIDHRMNLRVSASVCSLERR